MIPMLLTFTALAADPLPDLAANSSRVSCEAPATAKIAKLMPGAEQFYSGAFRVDGARVEGVERRYTWANSTWKAQGGLKHGDDCVDVWKVAGQKTAPHKCEDCAFGLVLQGDIDTTATTCERRLTADGNHFKTAYDVKVAADGTFEIFFTSGKPLAKGKQIDGAYAWMSDQGCVWF
ncbi:MAG: hypothetical protein H6737_17410 [Alphaproteobacteria bacterium]|nr:hypothetical protein [Alphaproteobacteria bacterium]